MKRTMTTLPKAIVLAGLVVLFCTKIPSDMDTLEQNIGATSLVAPADGSTDNILTPQLIWQPVDGALGYHVQVSTESDFSTIAFEDTAVTDTVKVAGDLKYKKMYYWRVKVLDATSFSEWTTHRIFTTIIEPMTPVSGAPKDSMKSVPTSLVLTWNAASGAASYCVQVSSDTGFKTIEIADSTLADTSKLLSNLANSRTYCWRVRSQNPGGVSSWTATRSFTTIIAAPKTPEPGLPAKGAVDQQLSLTLVWDKVSDASGYYVQVATDIAFANVFLKDSLVTDTSWAISGLVNGVMYYWRVKSKNDGGLSVWSATSGFMTLSALPERPVLVAPSDGALDQRFPLKVSWNKALGAGSYHVQVAIDSGFTALSAVDSTVTDTAYLLSVLANDTKYYWRVRAKNPIGVSAWSLRRSFTTFATTLKTPVLKLPADGSSGQSVALSLVWQSVSGVRNYHFQVSLTSDFASTVQDSVVTDTFAKPMGLANNTMYYWHVQAVNAPELSNWSSPWRFATILAPPPVPALISPADGITVQQLFVGFTWNKAATAATYHLQVSSDSNFSKNMAADSVLTDSTFVAGGLSNSTTYYWRVSAGNTVGSNGWSVRRSFITFTPMLTTPTLTSPQNGAADVDTALTISWSTVANASTYQVQVSGARDFTTVLIDDATLTSGSRQLSGLAHSTTYYWKVMAKNLSGAISNWTDPRSFTTIITTPGMPSLLLPSENAANQPVSLTLTWNKATGAASYSVQVATDTGFAAVSKDTALTDTLASVSGLLNSTTYYWRVKGKNASGFGNPSEYRMFTTIIALPATPFLSSPSDSALNVDLNPQISWNSVTGAASYHLQVATTQDFSTGLIVDDSTYTQTAKSIGPLSQSTAFFWRVQAKNAGGTSAWSARRIFTTLPPPPLPPTLVSPADGATGQPDTLTLTWSKTAGASVYYVVVATDTGFSSIVKSDSTVAMTDTTKVIKGLSNATMYYWRVQAKNPGGTGNWSGRRSFTTIRQFAITIIAVNGTVAKSPSQANYDSATVVSLNALPLSGYHFSGWSQDLTGTTNPATIAINAAKSVTATFVIDTPAVPAPVLPSNGAYGLSTTQKLVWTQVAAAELYCVQVARDSDFVTITSSDTTRSPADTAKTCSGLLAGATYYWHVQAINATGASAWSSRRNFVTINQYTVTISGGHGTVARVPDQPQYDLGTVVSLTAVPDPGYHFAGWSNDASGTSNPVSITVSTTINVTVSFVSDTPAAPVLTTPTSNQTGVPVAAQLRWTSVSGVSSYRVMVSTNPSFGSYDVDTYVSQIFYNVPTALANNTKYYWRVNATGSGVAGPWAVDSFTTVPLPPPAPVLVSPSPNATNVSTTPLLQWRKIPGVTQYRLTVGVDTLFSPATYDNFISSVNDTSKTCATLTLDKKYFWRVVAFNDGGSSRTIDSFTTGLAAPVLLTPGDSATGVPFFPVFTWNAVSEATTYHLQVSLLSNFSNFLLVNDSTLLGSSTVQNTIGPLSISNNYYWRVRAKNGSIVGPWSAVRLFTTAPLSWASVNTGLSGSALTVNALLRINGGILFAGTNNGLYRSPDSGKSWSAVYQGVAVTSLAGFGTNIFFGTTDSGMFMSTNSGISWAIDTAGIALNSITSLLVLDPYVFAGATGSTSGIYRCLANTGGTWTRMNNGLTNTNVHSLATSGSMVFAGTSPGAFASSDYGSTWSSISPGLPTSGDVTSLLWVSNGNKLFAGTDNNGVHLSTDNGATWASVTNNMTITCVKALATSANVVYAGMKGNGVYYSTDNGSNWVLGNAGLSSVTSSSAWIYCFTISNGELYAGTSGLGIFKTSTP